MRYSGSFIDPEKAAYLIVQIQLGIYDYLSLFKGINFLENITHKKSVFSLPEEEIMEVANEFAQIIEKGLELKK